MDGIRSFQFVAWPIFAVSFQDARMKVKQLTHGMSESNKKLGKPSLGSVSTSWLVNLLPLATYNTPHRNKGLTVGLVKGNQWLIRPYSGGG